jgi:hypothetical protein
MARGGLPRERHMDKYSPEFSAFWQCAQSDGPSASGNDHADASSKHGLSTAQELALEELAERVSAARSVI